MDTKGRKLFRYVAGILTTAVLMGAAYTTTVMASGIGLIDTASLLDIHAEADDSSAVVGQVMDEGHVAILGRCDGWVQIQAGEIVGWVPEGNLIETEISNEEAVESNERVIEAFSEETADESEIETENTEEMVPEEMTADTPDVSLADQEPVENSETALPQSEEQAAAQAQQAEEQAAAEAQAQSEQQAEEQAAAEAQAQPEQQAEEQAAAEAQAQPEQQAEEQAAAEAQRQAEEQAAAEAQRQAEEQAAAEAQRQAEEQAAAEAQRQAEEQAAAEAQRRAEEQAAAEAQSVQEQQAAAANQEILAAAGVTQEELCLLANIIYCEAKGEPYIGKVAVGNVVMNRVKSEAYPDSISEVIYAKGQFSPVRNGSMEKALKHGSADASCYQAALEALAGSSPVGDKLYFRRVNGRSGQVIGHHVFY